MATKEAIKDRPASQPTSSTSIGGPTRAQGEWQLVQRRRRFPENRRTLTIASSPNVRPYNPYSFSRTFAQIVASGSNTSLSSMDSSNSSKSTAPPSRPPTPPTPPGTHYYYSPHSPICLRFPPLATYPEWRSRCFNCCRLGHAAIKCRNPKKCGKYWADGHIASRCTSSNLNPAARPFMPVPKGPRRSEPAFEELL